MPFGPFGNGYRSLIVGGSAKEHEMTRRMKQKPGITGRPVVSAGAGFEQGQGITVPTVLLATGSVLAGSGTILLSSLAAWWPVFDIASHFTWHALGAMMGGTLALLLARCGATRTALGSLVLSAIATVMIPAYMSSFAELPKAQWAQAPSNGALRVVSLNTWHSNPQPQRMMAFLEEVQADVVFLSEFGPPNTERLRRLAKRYPHQVGCVERFYCAVQVISRHPISDARVLSRDKGTGPPSVHVTFDEALKRLHLIGVHLMRPIDSYRGSLREVQQIASLVRERRGGPTVVIGDFNLTGWSRNFATFQKASGLRHMGKFMPTWPAGARRLPQLAIDHAFASPDIAFESVGLGPSVGSDHKPIIVDIALPSAADGSKLKN